MRLSSLRQLTIASFAMVMVPLAVLVGYNQVSLSNIANIASSQAAQSIKIVRHVSRMESLALDIERLARQYTVVKKQALLELVEKSTVRFTSYQEEVCFQIPQRQTCEDLSSRIQWIKQLSFDVDGLLLDAQLAEFKQNLQDLAATVNANLDARIQHQQSYVSDVQQNQFWLIGILLSLSILLIFFGSRAILRPIEKVERVIEGISRQQENLPAISERGPQELIVLEQQLHKLAARLAQLETLRMALLRHASHELKTPLASIKEGCSLLSEKVVGPLNEQQQEVVSLLNSSTDRLNTLIIQLLDYNLLLQQGNPNWSYIETRPLFEEFVKENGLALKQHDNMLTTKIDITHVCADRDLFRRILDNLLSNAIAHGSKGRPLNVRLYQQGNMQVLDFANRGQKIPQASRDIMFQPFYRGEGKRNDRVVGTGLGLSIVADCARMMFGRAEIVDVDYADVCVRVMIPIKEVKV